MTSAILRANAVRQIADFEAKFGIPALHLACHAALAVAIDPDLLHLLRINFFLDPPEALSYTIEARLLLSPLCHEVDDLYRIDPDVRDLLLQRLEADFAPERIRDVATLLWQYTERNAPWLHRPELERAQQLTALNFLVPEKAVAWLDQEGQATAGTLSPQWFVAMRQRLGRERPEPENRQRQEIQTPSPPARPNENPARAALQALLQECKDILEHSGSHLDGWDALERTVAEMRALPDASFPLVADLLESQTEEHRLAAIVRLQQQPDPTYLRFLADRLAVERPFLGRQSALALEAAAVRLDISFQQQVDQAITLAQHGVRPSEFAADSNRILRRARLASLERLDPEGHGAFNSAARVSLVALSHQYNETRAEMPFSAQRTQALGRIATEMRSVAPVSRKIIAALAESPSAGERLAAVVLLQETPDPTFLPWLASRLGEEKHFIGFHAALALSDAAETLEPQYLQSLEEALRVARAGARRSRDPHQHTVLDSAEAIMGSKRQHATEAQRAHERRTAEGHEQLRELAQQYQHLRQTMPAGLPRTRQMERIAEQMLAYANEVYDLLLELAHSDEPGERLAAVTFLEARPHPDYLDWLAQRFDNDAPFIQWHAAVALLAASRQLAPEYAPQMYTAIQASRTWLGEGPDTGDRRNKLLEAEELLKRLETDLHTHSKDTDQSVEQLQQPDAKHTPEQVAQAPLLQALQEAAHTIAESDTGDFIQTSWKLWPNGSTLRIRFLDGDPTVQAKVQQYALEWTQYANLHFRFLPSDSTEAAEISISFKETGAWSYIGTEAKTIPPGQPTMNYGWFTPKTPDDEIRRTVLHEFGHALGLIHEYQSPHAHIAWNREAVYQYLTGPPNHWTHEQVDNAIFRRYQFDSPPDYRPFDPESIVLYPISKGWTLNGFEIGLNSELSASDKAFIARLYPQTTPS